MGAVPAQATIVCRAHASILPSFPKRGPLRLLVAVATALLALAYVLARELIGAPAASLRMRPAEPAVAAERRGSANPSHPAASRLQRPQPRPPKLKLPWLPSQS